jgi:asparagine synthase (glutamine-hydrolysing)
MSDLFVSAGLHLDPSAVSKRLVWTPYTRTWSGRGEGLVWAVSRIDDSALWGPAYDAESRVRVLLAGRVAFDAGEWDAAERLPYQGGLAARLILSRWINKRSRIAEDLNGVALIVVIDERAHEVHAWTDRMGSFPAFAWTEDGIAICSHPDILAQTLALMGRRPTFDPVTMAEFLRTGTSTHPHTYWNDVVHLDAGSHFRFSTSGKGLNKDVYWRPSYFEEPPKSGGGEFVERLAAAMRNAVRRRTHQRFGRVAIMLSAGADSRCALFSSSDPSRTTCYTLFDEPNLELRGAQRLAAAAGAQHVALQRDPNYYVRHASEAVRLSGGMWSIESAHYGGSVEAVRSLTPGVVLTGCYADYMFKGLALNRKHRTLLGRSIPLYELDRYRHEFYLSFPQIAPAWTHRVEARLDERFAEISRTNDPLKIEYYRLAPLAREGDASGRLFLWRTLPADRFFEDAEVLDLYGRMSVADKLSGIIFGKAVARLVGPAGNKVPNSNFGAPVGSGGSRRVAAFILSSLQRKLSGNRAQPFERDAQSVATHGAWPYFPRVIEQSDQLRDWRACLPNDQRELLFGIVGEERREWTLTEWAQRDWVLLLRLFTASLWLSQMKAEAAAFSSSLTEALAY